MDLLMTAPRTWATLSLLMTQGWGKHWGMQGQEKQQDGLVRGGLDPRGASRCPIYSHLLLSHSGFSFPLQPKNGVKSSAHRICLKVMNQDLDSQGLDSGKKNKDLQALAPSSTQGCPPHHYSVP